MGLVRKVLYLVIFLGVLYLGLFGNETFHIKPFISDWVTNYVDNKTDEMKSSITETINNHNPLKTHGTDL